MTSWPAPSTIAPSFKPSASNSRRRLNADRFSPVLLKMYVTASLRARVGAAEAALLQDFDDPCRFWVSVGARFAIDLRDADHLRIAAEKHVRRRRVERLAELLFELPAGDQVLDIDLATIGRCLARRQADVPVVRKHPH